MKSRLPPTCKRDDIVSTPAFIAGDWGTTHARLWLCAADGSICETRTAPGVSQLEGPEAVAAAFAAAVEGWSPALPAVLCGMVGSTIGWVDAGYQDCPCPLERIGGKAVRLEAQGRAVAILPGLRVRNGFGLTDVMRGEETQVFGAAALTGEHRFVAALPGTHNKWVVVDDGVVTNFHTALTGELYQAISRHTVLLGGDPASVTPGPAFDAGIEAVRRNPDAGVESLVFSVRARQVTGDLPKAEAASYLSGLLIGADIRSALGALGPERENVPIRLICAEPLAVLYGRGLAAFGLEAQALSGAETVRAGLHAAFRALA